MTGVPRECRDRRPLSELAASGAAAERDEARSMSAIVVWGAWLIGLGVGFLFGRFL